MKKLFPFATILLLTAALAGQTPLVQKGVVHELNSNKTPIPGVTIIFTDAKATDSDGQGQFRLVFQNKEAGDFIFKEEIRKQGYELVNEKDFEIVKLSNTDQLGVDVILAVEGTVDAAKKAYYSVSDKALLAGFRREKNILRTQLQQAKVSQEDYLRQLTALQEQYDRQKERLDALAEKFARVNFDDVEPYYEKALQLFKAGKIDEAIQMLESADPAKRTAQIIREAKRIADARAELDAQEAALRQEKQMQIAAVRLLADMYSLTFDPLKAEAQYDQLVRLDSTDLDILQNAADFYREQHRYEKAFRINPMILEHPAAEDWQKAQAYGHLGELFILTGSLPKALEAFKQFRYGYERLLKADPNSAFYLENLTLSYEKLGTVYSALGRLDSALIYFDHYRDIAEDLCTSYPEKKDFRNGLAISYEKLGATYSAQGQLDSALWYYERYRGQAQVLTASYPDEVEFRNNLAVSYSKLGETYQIMGQLDSALAYYQADLQLIGKLGTAYPQNIDYQHNLAVSYAKLGSIYSSLGRLDSALTYFTAYRKLTQELHRSYPQNVAFKQSFAIALIKLGETYQSLDQLDSALVAFRDGASLFEALTAAHALNVSFKNGLANSYSLLGGVHFARAQMDTASFYYDRYQQLMKELYDANPQNVEFKNGLAFSYVKSASMLLTSDLYKAKTLFEKAEILFSELVDQAPDNVQYKTMLDIVRKALPALSGLSSRQTEEEAFRTRIRAVKSLEKQIGAASDPAVKAALQKNLVDSLETIRQAFPGNAHITLRLANAYGSLAWFSLFDRQFAAAEQAARQGLETDPTQEWIYTNLALGLLFQSKWKAAKKIYESFKGKTYDTQNTWNEIFLRDLNELEAAGITHPDVEKVNVLLNK